MIAIEIVPLNSFCTLPLPWPVAMTIGSDGYMDRTSLTRVSPVLSGSGVELLTKPFTQAALGAKLRDIIDARSTPARVLVVEDEALIQLLAREYLEECAFKVDVASSAAEALNKLRLVPGGVDAMVIDMGGSSRPSWDDGIAGVTGREQDLDRRVALARLFGELRPFMPPGRPTSVKRTAMSGWASKTWRAARACGASRTL
jgi:hypothetical protein